MRAPAYAIGLTIIALVSIGCGKHYWNRPGASQDDFARDSSECARENARPLCERDEGLRNRPRGPVQGLPEESRLGPRPASGAAAWLVSWNRERRAHEVRC